MSIFLAECRRCSCEVKAYYVGFISEMIMTLMIFTGLLIGLGEHSKSYYLTFTYWYLASGIISNGSVSTSQEKQTGTLQQLLIKPISFLRIISYRNVYWTLFSLAQILVIIFINQIFLGINLEFKPMLILVFILLFIALQGVGVIITALTIKTAKIGNITGVISYGLLFISGGVIEKSKLPIIIQKINEYQPLSLAISATKKIIDEDNSIESRDIIIRLGVISLIYLFVGIVCYEKIYRSGKKYGIDNSY